MPSYPSLTHTCIADLLARACVSILMTYLPWLVCAPDKHVFFRLFVEKARGVLSRLSHVWRPSEVFWPARPSWCQYGYSYRLWWIETVSGSVGGQQQSCRSAFAERGGPRRPFCCKFAQQICCVVVHFGERCSHASHLWRACSSDRDGLLSRSRSRSPHLGGVNARV